MNSYLKKIVYLIFAFMPGILGSERTSTDPVFWSDFYTFLKATPSQIKRYSQSIAITKSSIKVIRYKKNYNIYRVPSQHLLNLKKIKAQVIDNPPFLLIDSNLHYRKQQNDIESWMIGYKDYDLINRIMFRFEELFPQYAKVYAIGKSRSGKKIYALKLSDNPKKDEDEPSFLFNSAHHGNEVLSIEYSLDLAYFLLFGRSVYPSEKNYYQMVKHLFYKKINLQGTTHYRSNKIQKYLNDLEIWIVPVVNPDGLQMFWEKDSWSGRKNHHNNPIGGVDLNRNYPFHWNSGVPGASSGDPGSAFYRGSKPASESETKMMMQLANRERFCVAFSYHTYATKILTPYTIVSSTSPQPNPAWIFAEKLVEVMHSHRKDGPYITQRSLYPVDGTDQDWLYFKFGTIAFIVEGSYHSPRYEPEGRKSIQGMRPAALKALDLFIDGPVITVHTVDELARPVGDTSIRLAHTRFFEGEDYKTHYKTGRYDFILEQAGDFTIIAQKKGFEKTKQNVQCNSGHCKVQIQLTRNR